MTNEAHHLPDPQVPHIEAEDRPTDAVADSWVDSLAPAWSRPWLRLARLDRPVGAWLLFWPCWWGLTLAAPNWKDWGLYLLFLIGAFVMRAAGCVYNDMVDRDFDRQVARTRSRPLASGVIGMTGAVLFLAALLFMGLLILLMLNRFSIWLGASSLLVVALYPFAKRFTDWPQFILGLAFNWGALLGFAAVTGGLGLAPIFLYVAGVFWTLGYDTIYAHQDKEDDALIGVRSTALKFGNKTKSWLILFYGGMILCLALAGFLANLHWLFYVVGAFVALHLAVQILRLNLDDPQSCLMVFRSNHGTGAMVFAAIAVAQLATHFGVN